MQTPNERKHYLIGPEGGNYVKKLFLTSLDADSAIRQTQKELLPSLEKLDAVRRFTDIQGFKRIELNKLLVEAQVRFLCKKIDESNWSEAQFLKFADKCCPYLDLPELQPVPFKLLRKYPNYWTMSILEKVATAQKNLPLDLQQTIWKMKKDLFRQHITTFIEDYKNAPKLNAWQNELRPSELLAVTKERRAHPSIKRITTCIGEYTELYEECSAELLRQFKSEPLSAYSMLKCDILIRLMETNKQHITDAEFSYNIVCILDAGIRTQILTETQLEDLRKLYDRVGRRVRSEDIHGELAFTLHDPAILNFLTSFLIQHLAERVLKTPFYKLDKAVTFLLSAINVGIMAADICVSKDLRQRAVSLSFMKDFFPSLVGTMRRDLQRYDRLKEDPTRGINVWIDECKYAGGLEEDAQTVLRKTPLARKIISHYIVDRFQCQDLASLAHLFDGYLRCLDDPDSTVSMADDLCHVLGDILLRSSAMYSHFYLSMSPFRSLLMDKFLLTLTKAGSWAAHLLTLQLAEQGIEAVVNRNAVIPIHFRNEPTIPWNILLDTFARWVLVAATSTWRPGIENDPRAGPIQQHYKKFLTLTSKAGWNPPKEGDSEAVYTWAFGKGELLI